MTTASLKFEINSLPKSLREEISDFVAFMKHKNKLENKLEKREFGYAKGKIKLSKDFDAPLPEFNEYM